MSNKICKTLNYGMYAFAFFALSSSLSAAQYKPLPVDGDGKLAPSSKFVSANGIVTASNLRKFRQDFRLFIDTQPSPSDNHTPTALKWWTDGEIKGIDKWGNNGYFTSTIALNNSQVAQLHPLITDKTPKIYYWRGDISNPAGGCWGVKGQLTNFNSSIGAIGSYGITAIWIYPSLNSTEERAVPVYKGLNVLDTANYPKLGKGDNSSADNLAAGYKWVVWGEYVREFLSDPETTVLCWRQTKTEGEIFNSRKLWRPVRIEFYGDFREVKP